jgi:hypothetical protein
VNRRALPISLTLLAILLATGIAAGARADALLFRDPQAEARELMYLPPTETARILALGFNQVMADWYWVKGLQYFTDPFQALNKYKNLADILDVVVGLDPDFEYAYKFGGIGIPYDTGRLHWANSEPAIDLLQRGVKRFPENWELHFHLGFYLLNFRNDLPGAAEQFASAARIPGSPPYLGRFAARLFSASGEVDRALVFAQTMLANATDPNERKNLEERIENIRLEGELRRVEDAARRFHEQYGRWPVTPTEATAAFGLPPPPQGVILKEGVAQAPPGRERLIVFEHPKDGRYETVQ